MKHKPNLQLNKLSNLFLFLSNIFMSYFLLAIKTINLLKPQIKHFNFQNKFHSLELN